MVILDLEWNTGYDKNPLEEILQIGAVRLDRLGGRITDTFCAYIRPQLHRSFSPPVKRLPELQLSLNSELDFPAAYGAFQAWCGCETEFAQWGHDDLDALRANCAHWDLPLPEAEKVYDFQWAFSAMLGQDRQIRLCDAVAYLQIPSPFCFHNALHDALYTAMVGEWMGEERALAEKPPKAPKRRPRKKHWQFAKSQFPRQSRRRVGPCRTVEALLDKKNSRAMVCPVCGKQCWVTLWYFFRPDVYYGPFRCSEHGTFLSRLTVSAADDGMRKGCVAIPAITVQLLETFEKAAGANRCPCKASDRKRKKRRFTPRRAKKKGAVL